MDSLENKSNNQIITELKQIIAEHESMKIKILRDYEHLEYLESRFKKANEIIAIRLKGSL